MKKVAIVQSNYIPWKGYFDLIAAVDEFILYDDMQFTRRDWRNRNRIKTREGIAWLTIPVEVKGKYLQPIRETRIAGSEWAETHWKTIAHSYARAAHYGEIAPLLRRAFEEAATRELLSEVNHLFLTAGCELLQIGTKLSWSMDYELVEGKNERLIVLCKQAGATHYLSGPAARDYIDVELFARSGIEVEFYDYSGYPEYRQLHGPFEHAVSVVDLLLNEGRGARAFLKERS
ncbi:MAG TPA: WbqC family protein [Thermoanaerobaculia bacterium]|nr:WbqC family protein [Thermoanaerobaculia bacterium]